jgi:predicted XRE-type DNA-binding protein
MKMSKSRGDRRTSGLTFEEGSDNIFADIGVRNPEDSLLRAKLAKRIAEIVEREKLTQTQIARILGVDQSKVSKLVHGRISGFTSDRLLRFLTALGCDIRIEIAPSSVRRRGKVVIAAA